VIDPEVSSPEQPRFRVILVTGDHPVPARAIAEHAGILLPDSPPEAVLTGDALESMREAEVVERLNDGVSVFARTTPLQKLKIVDALSEWVCSSP
jgi:sodium/potassium-transporting ATPase subunit alpha